MQQFSIKDIENLSGIKSHTLRIWEQRYGIIQPQRKESLHRFYSNEDLQHILKICYLYHKGMKISKIATLNSQQMDELISTSLDEQNKIDWMIMKLVEAALIFDYQLFEKIISEAFNELSVEQCYYSIVIPFFDKIGLMWMKDKFFPSQEHFASNCIRNKLVSHIELMPTPSAHNKKVILFTPHKEEHEIPILFVQYLLKQIGWSTFLLGTSRKLELYQNFILKENIQFAYVHCITNLMELDAIDYIKNISAMCPQIKFLFGGCVFSKINYSSENVFISKSHQETKQFFTKQFY